jgi:hypothetical protein
MLIQINDTMGDLMRKLDEMLAVADSGDETQLEGGEGLKGETDEDLALSGVKLYKGETLLELTERWRFIYERLSSVDDDNNMHFEYVSASHHITCYNHSAYWYRCILHSDPILTLVFRRFLIYMIMYDSSKFQCNQFLKIISCPHYILFKFSTGSLLHNPHIGLTDVFTRLYGMAKPMADCVVPQGRCNNRSVVILVTTFANNRTFWSFSFVYFVIACC